MCIVFWTLEHPDYALVLCANRDEYLTRPTQDACFHNFERGSSSGKILSGIDTKAGGSWLGLNKETGHIALLTNITEPYQTFDSSRGTLVSSFLLSEGSLPLQEDSRRLIRQDVQFAGFNMLLLAPSTTNAPVTFDALFISNNGAGGTITSSTPDRSCGCFSNGIQSQGGEDWPKVKNGKTTFASILKADTSEEELTERLFHMMTDQDPRPIEQRSDLRHTIQVAPFVIPNPKLAPQDRMYGTRLSTVILIKKDGSVLFIERDIFQSVEGAVKRADPANQRVVRCSLDCVAPKS